MKDDIFKSQELDLFLDSIELSLGRDKDSINVFEWMVEERNDKVISDNLIYFPHKQYLIDIQNETAIHEIELMLEYFKDKEEYEKCSRLIKIRENLKSKIDY